jgi:hypothetical protein
MPPSTPSAAIAILRSVLFQSVLFQSVLFQSVLSHSPEGMVPTIVVSNEFTLGREGDKPPHGD